MKQLKRLFVVFAAMMVFLSACASKDSTPFTIEEVNMQQVQSMMDEKQSFTLLVERENCPFCEAMNAYIEKTKNDHPDILIYKLDVSDYEMYREEEGDMTLISQSDDGAAFLERFPYYLYTPAIYKINEGTPVIAGIGFDETRGTVSLWDVNSTIDFTTAKQEDLWDYFKAAPSSFAESADDTAQNETAQQNSEEEQGA